LKVSSHAADVEQPDAQTQYKVKDSWHIKFYKWSLNCHKVLQSNSKNPNQYVPL